MTSVKFSGKNRVILKELARKWGLRTYDNALKELLTRCCKLDSEVKQTVMDIECFDIETKLNKPY